MRMITIPLLSLICVIILGRVAFREHTRAFQAGSLERAERELLEGFLRTKSGRIDSAYVCREKK